MASDDDEQLVRKAIAARGDMARIGAFVHAILAVICIALLVQGAYALPFGIATGAFVAIAVWLELQARKRREGRSPVLHALLHRPGEVQHLVVVHEESGVQVRVTAAGATDFVCPPGALEDLLAALRRRSPQATFADHRR